MMNLRTWLEQAEPGDRCRITCTPDPEDSELGDILTVYYYDEQKKYLVDEETKAVWGPDINKYECEEL